MLSIQQATKSRTTITTNLFVSPYTGGFTDCDPVVAIAPQGDIKILGGVQGILG